MKKLFLLLFSVLAFTSQVRADVEWTIWEGSIAGGNVQGKSKLDFSILEEGDMICVYGTGTLSKAIYRLSGSSWDWNDITSSAPAVDATYGYYHVVTATFLTNFDYSSDETKSWAVGNWNDGTITKVTIKKAKSAIRTTLSSDTKDGDSFEYTIPKADLSNMVEGDFIRLSTSQRSKVDGKDYKIQFKLADNEKGWPEYTTLWGPTHDAIWRIDNTAITAGIKDYPLYIYGELYKSNGVYLYHPVNSFKIGSIEMATFSAAQTVKVPDGLTAYKATVSGDNVTLTTFTGNIIPANQGAIIKGPQGSVVEFAATSEGSSDISDLIAVTTATDVTTLDNNYDYYVLYAGTGEKEDELDLSILLGNFGNWNNKITWDSSTNTATYTEQTPNGEGGWVGKDWSAYDKLKLNFSANTLNADATFYVAYNGHDDATTEATLTQGSTSSIEIDLNSNYKDAIGNFSMWSGATSGSITFESAALIDNDGATVAEFRKTESGTIAANKAYLRIEKSETPSKLNIVFAEDENKQDEEQQGETNSIRNIANTNVNNNVVYNMNGQRVGSDYKGLVIVNGKKIIKK